jgi:membrane associated rhomboid family serine protease
MIPLKDRNPSQHFPAVTLLLIGANVVVFLIQLSLPPAEQRALFEELGLVPARYTGGGLGGPDGMLALAQAFLTSMFLHGGWLHLIANMWSLWLFGDNVEDRMGHARFLAFYLLAGFAAGALHIAFAPRLNVPTVGASGAIAGVMGAYVFMFPGARIVTLIPLFFIPLFVDIPALVFIGFWFVSQLFSGVTSIAGAPDEAGIAWWAHVGGFAFGAVTLPIFKRKQRGDPRERTRRW